MTAHFLIVLHPPLNPAPNPTAPSITAATTHLVIAPEATNPAALTYPHPSNILNASRFCTATAHSTPFPTLLPTFQPSLSLSASSYFHTTIKIGNNFIQELTISAVVMPFAVARGVVSSAPGAASEVDERWCCTTPSPRRTARQRMVRCCARVISVQRRR